MPDKTADRPTICACGKAIKGSFSRRLKRHATQCLSCATEAASARRYPDGIAFDNDASAARARRKALGKYGLTQESFEALVEAQGRRCLGCGEERKLVVDHDHATGVVRGLLCGQCNTALGFAYDSPTILRALADYLEREKGS
jgi:hypothetical protein